jgi:hypothetical protein
MAKAKQFSDMAVSDNSVSQIAGFGNIEINE